MFDLESAIKDWKDSLQNIESVSEVNIVELEEHLRESIADFAARGLTPEEAFLATQARLGSANSLGGEFSKVNGPSIWRRRTAWMLFGYLGINAFGIVANAVAGAIGAVSLIGGLGGRGAALITSLATLVAWLAFFVLILRRSHGRGARLQADRISIQALVVVCLLILIGHVIDTVAANLQFMYFRTSDMGEYALWFSFCRVAIGVGVVAGLIGTIMALRERQLQPTS